MAEQGPLSDQTVGDKYELAPLRRMESFCLDEQGRIPRAKA